ncbi:MAG: hypothetical protein HC880_22465 [Bacteroidia bacterium]|nr:hypothetical protein [Bacteroidia bacterium]
MVDEIAEIRILVTGSSAFDLNQYKYLDLLAKVYVVFPLKAFSRNLRKEIVKGKKLT